MRQQPNEAIREKYVTIKAESRQKCKATYNRYMNELLKDDETPGNKRFWAILKAKEMMMSVLDHFLTLRVLPNLTDK